MGPSMETGVPMPDRPTITPKIEVTRFEQLKPGDLFICLFDEGACLALKAEDPERNGDKLILPLGPIFPAESGGIPLLLSGRGVTVISFGRDYILRMPVDASGWTARMPERNKVSMMVADGNTYIRAFFDPSPDSKPCWVRLDNGLIAYSGIGGIPVFATSWEIVLADAYDRPRVVLKYP